MALLGGRDSAAVDFVERVWRSQRDRELRKLCRREGSAASASVRRRRVEGQRDILVGAGRRDREMTCAFFEIDVQLGEATMEAAPCGERQGRIAGRSEERMGEADPVAVELEHTSRRGESTSSTTRRPQAAPRG